MKKVLKIALVIIAIAAIVAVIIVLTNLPSVKKVDIIKNPRKVLTESFEKTVSSIENSTFTPIEVAEKTLDKGSITISSDSGLNCLISHDFVNKKYKTEYTSQNSSWNWALYDYAMYLANDTNTYQLPLTNYEETIEASKIPEVRGKLELPLPIRIKNFYPGFASAYKGETSDSTGKIQLLGENILNIVFDAENIVEEEFLDINGKQVNVYSVEYRLDHDATVLFLNTLLNWCNQYEQGYDNYVSNVFQTIISDISGVEFNEQIYKKYIADTVGKLKSVATRSTAPSFFKISIDPKSGHVVYFDWILTDTIYNSKTDVSLNVILPTDYSEVNYYRICCEMKSGVSYYNCKAVFNLTQQETNNFVEKALSIDYQDSNAIWKEDSSLHYDKNDNSFIVKTQVGEDDKTVSGDISLMGSEIRLFIDKMQIEDNEYTLNLSAVITDVPANHTPPENAINVLNTDIENVKSFYELTKALPELVFGIYRSRVENRV